MAAIDELIEQIDNPTLRERIAAEVHRVVRQKKFGLVFEEHLPERTLLYEVPIQRGSLVARNGNTKDVYQVIGIDGGKALLVKKYGKGGRFITC
jgi:adenine-specific DNA-methyltransferase